MTTTAAKTAVQAFICCRMDYCNSMLYGMSDGLLWKIQSIQKAAARLVTVTRPCDYHAGAASDAGAASAALTACPSTSRVHGCMPGTPVAGWSDTCIHSRRHPTRYGQWSPSATFSRRQDKPRSTDAQQLRRSKLQCCNPPPPPYRVWNSLPPHLRRDMNFARFKRQLKTFLFGSKSTTVHCDCLLFFRRRNTLKYLLLRTMVYQRKQNRWRSCQSSRTQWWPAFIMRPYYILAFFVLISSRTVLGLTFGAEQWGGHDFSWGMSLYYHFER